MNVIKQDILCRRREEERGGIPVGLDGHRAAEREQPDGLGQKMHGGPVLSCPSRPSGALLA